MPKPRYDSMVFYAALGLSILIHLWIAVLWMILHWRTDAVKAPASAITYYFEPSQTSASESVSVDLPVEHLFWSGSRGNSFAEPAFLQANDVRQKPYADNFLPAEPPVIEKNINPLTDFNEKPETRKPARKVSVPVVSSTARSDDYPEYFNMIGGKIHDAAYEKAAKIHHSSGEVHVVFALQSSGRLQKKPVVQDSSAPAKLQEAALRSVEAAAPFPPFPKEMNSPDMVFNVVIDFDLE